MMIVSENENLEHIKEIDISDVEFKNAEILVNKLTFNSQNKTLVKYYGWHESEVETMEDIYKKWLILHKIYGEKINMAPNKRLDEYWHFHILDTSKYIHDCNSIFGRYLHHFPYFGIDDKTSQQDLDNAFEIARFLFWKHFDHDLISDLNRCSSTSCR